MSYCGVFVYYFVVANLHVGVVLLQRKNVKKVNEVLNFQLVFIYV